MLIHDQIYSDFNISSPIILELISTQTFQRLKGISQFGIPNDYYHLAGYSRFDHSLGVYILLNKLKASEEEQIAGLLHDVSHTAFSHLIDWVIGDSSKEDYQDKRHLLVLQQPEVAQILNKYGFSPEIIADYHRFTILELDLPNLCADRIDYVLRESTPKIIAQCLADLKVLNSEIIFSNEKSAYQFASNFLKKQTEHWAGYEATTRYVILSHLLKNALKDKTISLTDFNRTDDYVISKLIKSRNVKYLRVLDLLKDKDLMFLHKSRTKVRKKFRYVDPKILKNGELVKLSVVNRNFYQKLEQARLMNKQGTFVGAI